MPTTNHAVTVTIDGVDRSASLLYDALSVRVGVGNTGNVADLEVMETEGYSPQPWDEVLVAVDETRIFGGYVTTRTVRGVGSGSGRMVRWALTCRDWSLLLDKIMISEQFAGMTDANIVRALFNEHLAAYGFNLAEIQFTRAGLTIGFERLTLRAALNKLAEQVGAAWYIDATKGIWWYNRWSPPRAAFDIDTVAPDGVKALDMLAGGVQRTIDDSTAINRVEVFGKDVQGQLRTETLAPTGNEFEFGPLSYRVHSAVSVTLSYSGTKYGDTTVRGDAVGYEPDAVLFGTEGVDAERVRSVVINREQRTVKARVSLPPSDAPNPNSVTITYYELAQVYTRIDDANLQALHERVLTQQVYDPNIADEAQAEQYGRYLLDVYGRGAETIVFEAPEFGLLPGSEINVHAPALGIDRIVTQANLTLQDAGGWLLEDGSGGYLLEAAGESTLMRVLLENGARLLWEDGDQARLERVRDTGNYIVQEVSYHPVHTPDGWMMVAAVTAGEPQRTLVDIVTRLAGGGGVASLPAAGLTNRVSDIASDLGEVVAGRAVFTDGGLGPFDWAAPNGHSGVVLGLDDSDADPRGALGIYDGGVQRLKLGRLNGLPNVGTAHPAGWGIWTDNGYFQGVVAASVIEGGTVRGGTVSGALISGGTIGGAFVYGGTVRSSAGPVNTSNPGWYADASGIYGYGTLGLTFMLPTDPALRPVFSSGTILNTVYEVYDAAVIRTGTINPRVQMDSSGIFAWGPTGALKFAVDAATGLLTAVDGAFSGVVAASRVVGGTVSGAVVSGNLVSGGTVSGALVSGGTVSGALVSGNQVSGGTVSGALVSGNQVSGGTVSGALISGNLVSGGTVSGSRINGGTVTGALVSGNQVSGGTVSGALVSGAQISGGTVSGALVSGGTVSGSWINGGTATFAQANGTAVIDNRGIVYNIGANYWPFGLQFMDAGWIGGGVVAGRLDTYHEVVVYSDGPSDAVALRAGMGHPFLMDGGGIINYPPRPSLNGGLALGDETHAWRYLYLYDTLGVVRRLEVQFGTLVIT